MSRYWYAQLVLLAAAACVAVGVVVWLVCARNRARRVRAADVRAAMLLAALGVDGLARDTRGVHGHPRRWVTHRAGRVLRVLPEALSVSCEELMTDRRLELTDAPELPGGWSRYEVGAAGRRALTQAGVVPGQRTMGDQLVSRRHARAVAAVEEFNRAA